MYLSRVRRLRYPLLLLVLMVVVLAACDPGRAADSSVGAAFVLPPTVRCTRCWHPPLRTSWQWQLTGRIDVSVHVSMYDIDMFDTPAAVLRALHARGRKVICYVDAGSWENWRPDAKRFPKAVIGKPLSGWPGERWLDVRRLSVLEPLMKVRLALCKAKGFDGVELDNVDGYTNDTGFRITSHDQLLYNVTLANDAHRLGLSVALKNDLDQIPRLLPYFDWALDEQCFQYQECDALRRFTRARKAVMEVEYNLATRRFCPRANRLNFNAMRKHLSLDAYRVPCR